MTIKNMVAIKNNMTIKKCSCEKIVVKKWWLKIMAIKKMAMKMVVEKITIEDVVE